MKLHLLHVLKMVDSSYAYIYPFSHFFFFFPFPTSINYVVFYKCGEIGFWSWLLFGVVLEGE